MKKLIAVSTISTFIVSTFWMVSAGATTTTCDPTRATMLPVSAHSRRIEIFGREVGHQAIQKLWGELTTKQSAHITFGKIIAADQDWFASCSFPGLGIAVGSGYSLDSRNTIFFVWADEVDMKIARDSIISFALDDAEQATVDPVITTTSTTVVTSTTTSTTVASQSVVDAATDADTSSRQEQTSSQEWRAPLSPERVGVLAPSGISQEKRVSRHLRKLCNQVRSNPLLMKSGLRTANCMRVLRGVFRSAIRPESLDKTQISKNSITKK